MSCLIIMRGSWKRERETERKRKKEGICHMYRRQWLILWDSTSTYIHTSVDFCTPHTLLPLLSVPTFTHLPACTYIHTARAHVTFRVYLELKRKHRSTTFVTMRHRNSVNDLAIYWIARICMSLLQLCVFLPFYRVIKKSHI